MNDRERLWPEFMMIRGVAIIFNNPLAAGCKKSCGQRYQSGTEPTCNHNNYILSTTFNRNGSQYINTSFFLEVTASLLTLHSSKT